MKTLDEVVKINIAIIVAKSFAGAVIDEYITPDGMVGRVKHLCKVLNDLIDESDTSMYSSEEIVLGMLTMVEEFVNINHVEQNKKHLH